LRFRSPFTFKLRQLILLLAITATAAILFSGLYISYQVQKERVIEDTLKSNHVFASKLASATDYFLAAAMQQLEFSAKIIAKDITNTELLQAETNRLLNQTHSFNSVAINMQGVVKAASPVSLNIINKTVNSPHSKQAFKLQRPLVSRPYVSLANNLIVVLSYPLFDEIGNYYGYIGGSFYLEQQSILNALLKQHSYDGGAYFYVVADNKTLLYHPETERIGEQVINNPVIERVLQSEDGYTRVLNSQGVSMLAGYSPVKLANWGVVAQRSEVATLATLDTFQGLVLKRMLPIVLITFVLIGVLAHFIAKPLRLLADSANLSTDQQNVANLKSIKSWYFESQQLKAAMLEGVNILQSKMGQLRQDALTDPLTGAHNRRGLYLLLDKLIQEQIPFAVLEIDIDFFKRVNDTFGHDVGDEVLKTLTCVIKQVSRKDDIVARTGGEEFLLILPNENSDSAFVIAEWLRNEVANTPMAKVGCINVSIGIATWPQHSDDIDQVYKCADKALYHAKETGRNKTVIASLN
jgi:diguanylate cyclase (GGDEF)-like protein